ncbi:MAG TPA: HAMP domain-containing sensor histidine kinase [Actinomycetes bacterium]|jgi:signal transduction histidine kinase|nr:HAMP domain-containing sensor histidine kinase [Actinomycetes bacterium]
MSFRARLTLAYLALLTVALSAFGLGVYAYVDRNLRQEFYASVQRESGQLAQRLSDFETADNVGSETLDRWTNDQEPDTFIVVETRKDPAPRLEVFAKYPQEAMAARDLPEVPAGRVIKVRSAANDLGLPLAVYAETFKAKTPKPGQGTTPPDAPKQFSTIEGRVTVARSLAGVERSLGLLRTILVAGGLAVLLVAALLGLGLAAALLRPLARMRATAQQIGDERDFSHRMPVDGNRHDELGRLSQSFNQMLAELEQSNLDLKSTLDSQRRFVADASHELRTPLTAIRTNVEFLSRVPGARPEDRGAALHDILAELRRMESLVGDLLALARLEAAASRPSRRTFRLDHLLVDVHREALRVAPPGLEVVLGPVPEVWVSGDRDDLRRAVWNLVDNALKYTRTGRVDLRLHAVDGVAELAVRDTGVGIAPSHLEHVFDRFWRAPGVRGMAGSGLGLAITKWVAQAHDGTVAVESVAGQGTTFVLTLPVVRGPVRGRARQRDGQLVSASRQRRTHS